MTRASVERNYKRGLWGINELKVAVRKGIITVDDFIETTSQPADSLIGSIDNIKARKLNELSRICEQVIINGITVETSKGLEHFSLTVYDQMDLTQQVSKIKEGATQVQYHADDGICRWFTAEEIVVIATKADFHATYNKTYFNHLKALVVRSETIEEVNSVVWGQTLPEDLDTNFVSLVGVSTISE